MREWFSKVAVNSNELLQPGRMVYVNLYNYNYLRPLLRKFDKVYFDGIGLLQLYNVLTRSHIKRMSPDNTTLMPLILERFSNFVVCGGTDSEVRHFCDKLLGNKHVIYQSSGYRTIDDLTVELNSVIDNYKYTEPLVMLLGLGSPKQELVSLDLNISNKNVTVFTVGGFISQYSSNPEYFPPLYDKFNIRFIYRLMNEPGHWKRFPAQFNGIFLFIKDWLWQKINADKGVNSHEIT